MALPAPRAVERAGRRAADAWAEDLLARAHERTVRARVPEMAAYLQGLLGQKLTALMVSIENPKAIGK